MTRRERSTTGPAAGLASFVLFVGVLLAVLGAVLVVNQLTQPGGAVDVVVQESVLGLDAVDGLPEGTWLQLPSDVGASGERSASVALEVAELPAWLRALTELPFLLSGLLTLVGALVLRRFLLEVAAGRPFSDGNPARLQVLAGLALAGSLLPGMVASLATVVTLEHLGASGPGSPLGFSILELSLGPFLVAAVLLVVAAVFRHGQQLTQDVEGLV